LTRQNSGGTASSGCHVKC